MEKTRTNRSSVELVSLPNSSFEIDNDANLKLDGSAPALDWGTVTEIRKVDLPTGAGDDSFGQGSKEDTPVPSVVDGSIPPNKSDLLHFGVYLEQTATTKFLHLFWHRVQEPSGTIGRLAGSHGGHAGYDAERVRRHLRDVLGPPAGHVQLHGRRRPLASSL